MRKTAFAVAAGIVVLGAVNAYADEPQESFLSSMKEGLEARWKYSDVDESGMSAEEFVEHREKLVDVELSALQEYEGVKFDEDFEWLANGYVEALEMQKNALKYYQSSTELYDIEWGAGYNARAVIIADLYENYGLDISPEQAQTFIDARNGLYSYEIVSEDIDTDEQTDEIIEIVSKEAEKQEYGGWKIAYKSRNVSEDPISDLCLNATVYDADNDIIGTVSYTTQATVSPGQAVTVDIYVQEDNAASIKIESFYYNKDGAFLSAKYPDDELLVLNVSDKQGQGAVEVETGGATVTMEASEGDEENKAESQIPEADDTMEGELSETEQEITLDEDTPDSDFLYATNNGEAVIRSYRGTASKVIIPNEIDGNVVTTIAEKAFYKNTDLNSVSLPAGLKRVGDSAFSGCDNLKEVVFPKEKMGDVIIEHEAFYNDEISGQLIINASSVTIGPNAFAINKIEELILYCDKIIFQDHPFGYNPMKSFFMNADAQVSYDGNYMNSKTGDVFTVMEDLEELYLPSSCSFLTEESFVETPKVTLIGMVDAAWIADAQKLWIPVSTDGYENKANEVTKQLEEKGYDISSAQKEETILSQETEREGQNQETEHELVIETEEESIVAEFDTQTEEVTTSARQAEQFFREVIDEVDKENEGKKYGDDFAECDRMYLNTYLRLYTLQDWIDEGKSLDELEGISLYLFGKPASNIEELQGWHDNMESYMVDKNGKYLDFLMSKMKSLSTVEGDFEETHIDMTVNSMDAFLEELIASPEAFGKIWAVTELYAGETKFTDDGFSFTWNASGEFSIDLDAIENVGRVYTDQETILLVQDMLNKLGYDCGTPDGIAGQRTQSMINSYRQDHGMSEGTDITQELLNHMKAESESIEDNHKSIQSVMEKVITLPSYSTMTVSEPVEQEGMIGYVVLYNDNRINVICNPDNDGKTTIGILPDTLVSDNGASDYLDFLGFMIQSVDDEVSGYEAYGIAMQAYESGHYVQHAIEYDFSTEDLTMFINY